MAAPGPCIDMPLKRELAYFAAQKAHLLANHRGKFVLIKDEELLGAFDTAEAAYAAGVAKFGLAAFLVKKVLDQDETYRNAAFCLGLMHARF
jgi:hypothetical protein